MTMLDRTITGGCGCGAPGEGSALIGLDAALAWITSTAEPVAGSCSVGLAAACGRVLADPVRATGPTPPFDAVAMDGYALDTRALTGAGPWMLDVGQRVPAGGAATARVGGLQAARVLTGAPLPPGADAVVMQEAVTRTGAMIRLDRRPDPGLNIRPAGSDLRAGQKLLDAGRRLGPRDIAVAAAAGAAALRVRRRLRVALMVTGDELRAPDAALSGGQIRDVNGPMIAACLSGAAFDLAPVVQAADDRAALAARIAALAARSDLVVTTGGLSVGEEDHVRPALQALGADILFSGVAIKPGKPVSVGRIGAAWWLGLPGNPLAAHVTWQLFGTALVRRLTGQAGAGTPRRHVVTAAPIRRKPGRCELRPCRLAGFDPHGREVAHCDDALRSASVGGLPAADGLLFLPAEVDHLPAGALVEFMPYCDH